MKDYIAGMLPYMICAIPLITVIRIMNTLGAVIGYGIYIPINKFAHSFFENSKSYK